MREQRHFEVIPPPKGSVKKAPRWLILAAVLGLAFYLVNALHYQQLPLRIEEREWPPMAKAIFETGKPVITNEAHRVAFDENLQIEHSELIGAWHPPLYLYTLAASMALVGTNSPDMLRAVGAIGLLATAILLLLIAREVTSRWRLIGGIAAILLLIHPYAIQGSLFLDIDNSIYAPLALLAIWLAIRYNKRQEPLSAAQAVLIGSALALVTWTKMTTTIVLVGVLVFWWLFSRRPLSRAIIEAGAFVGIGAGLFFSTYALWCDVTGIPFSYTFDVTFAQKSNRLFSDWQLVEHSIHWHFRWLGPAFILLAFAYLIDLIRNLVLHHRFRPLDLPFLLSIGILVQYVVLSPTDGTYQGKYAFPALASMLLPIIWMLLRKETERVRPFFLATAAIIAAGAALITPDLLTNVSLEGHYGTWEAELEVAAVAGAALLLAWSLAGKQGFATGAVVVLVVLVASQASDSYRANTSPMYPIPDTEDFRAAARDLNKETSTTDIVVAPKDLGLYIKRRVVEGEDAFARGDALLAAVIRRHPEITAFARDSFGPPVGPTTEAILAHCFLNRHTYGSASIVYRTRDCG